MSVSPGLVAAMVGGAALASTATGPLAQTFDAEFAVYAIMGALGGLTFALWRWPGRWQVLRRVSLGALMGAGLSAIAVPLVGQIFGVDFTASDVAPRLMRSACYVVGFAQERVGRWIEKGKIDDGDGAA